jgi:hypothetical protein
VTDGGTQTVADAHQTLIRAAVPRLIGDWTGRQEGYSERLQLFGPTVRIRRRVLVRASGR